MNKKTEKKDEKKIKMQMDKTSFDALLNRVTDNKRDELRRQIYNENPSLGATC